MAKDDAKEQLLDLLDRKVFDPVLDARPDDYDEGERDMLREVQEQTRSTRRSYQHYEDAAKVREMFRDDLHSDAAEKVHDRLKKLGLPTMNDAKDEFEALARKLDVK